MALATKRSIVVFPFRSAEAGAQPKLPACAAFRVIAVKAALFAADAPGVVAKVVPAAPAGCADGAYPVWASLTDRESGMRAPAPILIDGDGWNTAGTGRDWTLDFCGGAGTAADVLAYVVEIVSDVREAGQVNGGAAAVSTPAVVTEAKRWTGTDPILQGSILGSNGQMGNAVGNPYVHTFKRPARGARTLALQYQMYGWTCDLTAQSNKKGIRFLLAVSWDEQMQQFSRDSAGRLEGPLGYMAGVNCPGIGCGPLFFTALSSPMDVADASIAWRRSPEVSSQEPGYVVGAPPSMISVEVVSSDTNKVRFPAGFWIEVSAHWFQ